MSNAYADTVGGKPQEAEAAGACEQRIGMGAGAGSLRKGAG